MFSPLLSNCSPFKTARKANIAKEVTDNKADSHWGKRLVLKYPIPVMNIPRYMDDHPVHAIASPNKVESAPVAPELFMASETRPIDKPTIIISNPASMKLFFFNVPSHHKS